LEFYPYWLLSVMHGSRLFETEMAPVLQGLAYLHEDSLRGGHLYYYPDGPGKGKKWFEPKPNSGIFFDGVEVWKQHVLALYCSTLPQIVHGVQRVTPQRRGSDLFNKASTMVYNHDKKQWEVTIDESEELIDTYRCSYVAHNS